MHSDSFRSIQMNQRKEAEEGTRGGTTEGTRERNQGKEPEEGTRGRNQRKEAKEGARGRNKGKELRLAAKPRMNGPMAVRSSRTSG